MHRQSTSALLGQHLRAAKLSLGTLCCTELPYNPSDTSILGSSEAEIAVGGNQTLLSYLVPFIACQDVLATTGVSMKHT